MNAGNSNGSNGKMSLGEMINGLVKFIFFVLLCFGMLIAKLLCDKK